MSSANKDIFFPFCFRGELATSQFNPVWSYRGYGTAFENFLLPSPVCINASFCLGGFGGLFFCLIVTSSVKFWNLSSGNLEFYKGTLVCGCLPKSLIPNCGGEGLKPEHRFLLVPQPIPRSVWLLLDAQVGEIPLRSHNISHRDAFINWLMTHFSC